MGISGRSFRKCRGEIKVIHPSHPLFLHQLDQTKGRFVMVAWWSGGLWETVELWGPLSGMVHPLFHPPFAGGLGPLGSQKMAVSVDAMGLT